MGKGVVFTAIIVILLGVGAVLLLNQRSAQPTPPQDETVKLEQVVSESPSSDSGTSSAQAEGEIEGVIVSYTDSGYSPKEVRVKVGTTVNFRNESSDLMWTASAIHPTHQILPAFDPRKGFSAGEVYSFTFTKQGTFNYHNHLNPSRTGSVVVEES